MKVEFRRMERADIAEVAALEQRTFSMPWSEGSFASMLEMRDAFYLVALAEGTLAGYCGFLQSFDEAEIVNVAVREELRGQGIGYRMLEALMEQGGRRGVSRFTLEVRAGNAAALCLYRKLGFEAAGLRRGFYEKPREDAVIMWTQDMRRRDGKGE